MREIGAGFFSNIFSGMKSFATKLFSGSKEKIKQVATQAINHAKTAGAEALKTGDLKGAAKKAFSAVKKEATNMQEMSRIAQEGKEKATAFLKSKHQEALQKLRGTACEGVGSGFLKKHFARTRKHIHRHLDTLHHTGRKHVKSAYEHIKKEGKAGIPAMKKRAHAILKDVHRNGLKALPVHLKTIQRDIQTEVKKKIASKACKR